MIVDDATGGAAVAQHLVDAGHERIVLLARFSFASSTTERSRGFLTELEHRGVDLDRVPVVHGGLTAAEGRALTESLLAAPEPATAIFAVAGYLALGVVAAVHRAGLITGRDIAVVGYNDLPIARELPVPMSSEAVPLDILGAVQPALSWPFCEVSRPSASHFTLSCGPRVLRPDSTGSRPGRPEPGAQRSCPSLGPLPCTHSLSGRCHAPARRSPMPRRNQPVIRLRSVPPACVYIDLRGA